MFEPRWTGAIVLASVIFVTSCDNRPTPAQQARACVNTWKSSGMMLPSDEDCSLFRSNLTETKPVLEESLRHVDAKVRMRGAYVIEKLGPDASPLSGAVVNALSTESDSLVRVYLINAARSVGRANPAALTSIRQILKESAEVRERLYAAAAAFVLSDERTERASAEEYVCGYLIPYEMTSKALSAAAYDDLQWSAVNAVQHMIGAQKPIPLLEERVVTLPREHWIHAHAPRALKALRDRSAEP